MDNVYEISLLIDFYGQLLTDRQFEILDLHYNNDYSLGEIAEHLDISRQGVFDNLKRGKAALNKLENKLGLVRKFAEHSAKAEKILSRLNSIDKKSLSLNDRDSIEGIKSLLEDIINS